ncbi:MAG: hypothetical protein U5N85_00510 [Arcicella sp.]|nr:hypothetical protein [Arcicella sp.]
MAVTVNPLPSTPTVGSNASTTFCADTSVVLSSSIQNVVSYRWNTGATSPSITVRNSGDYSVRTVDRNGCVSLQSSVTKVNVNPFHLLPVFSSSKDTVFCQCESTILD